MKTITMVGPSVSGIHNLILQRVKHRELRMNTNALAYRPIHLEKDASVKNIQQDNKVVRSAIRECRHSLSKLMLIADFLKVANPEIVEGLLISNRFDNMTKQEILDELVAACG